MANGEPAGTNTCAMNGLSQYQPPFTVATVNVAGAGAQPVHTPAAGKKIFLHSISWGVAGGVPSVAYFVLNRTLADVTYGSVSGGSNVVDTLLNVNEALFANGPGAGATWVVALTYKEV